MTSRNVRENNLTAGYIITQDPIIKHEPMAEAPKVAKKERSL